MKIISLLINKQLSLCLIIQIFKIAVNSNKIGFFIVEIADKRAAKSYEKDYEISKEHRS